MRAWLVLVDADGSEARIGLESAAAARDAADRVLRGIARRDTCAWIAGATGPLRVGLARLRGARVDAPTTEPTTNHDHRAAAAGERQEHDL